MNKVDFVSKMVFVCSTRLVRHKTEITKRKSDAGSFALTVGRADSTVVFVNWDSHLVVSSEFD